jgi:putative redox protein
MANITATLKNGTRIEVTNQRHTWYADEPLDHGGTDTGPTPYEMLMGSLAACTVMTLQYYTQHKGIPLESIRAEYKFDRIHAEDCEVCEEPDTGMIERVQAHVTFTGEFDEAQRIRLEQVASRCPVHKTLTHGMKILDRVTFEQK